MSLSLIKKYNPPIVNKARINVLIISDLKNDALSSIAKFKASLLLAKVCKSFSPL